VRAETNGASVHTHQADIVIVGAGAAGAMAALAANEQGATFVGLDQLPEFGGTAIVSGGGMSVAGTPMQAERGIEDSPDRAFRDLMAEDNQADPAWGRFYYDHVQKELYGYLMGLGIEYVQITTSEVDSVPRRHVPKRMGLGLMTTLLDVHKARGLDRCWHQSMTAKDLIWEDGRVVGVLAEDENGERHEFHGKAVILGTGGFTGSLPMVLKYSERLARLGKVLAGGGVGALGRGHEILLRHGATLTNVDNFVIYVYATPDYEDPKLERGLVIRGTESCIWVNGSGQRFHDETQNGSIYGPPAVMSQDPPFCWVIMDNQMAGKIDVSDPRYRRGSDAIRDRIWQLLRESPYIASGSTLEEVARNAGFDADQFQRTVANWNALLASGADRDPATGRELKDVEPILEAPFFAVQFWPLARKNQGGIRTDLRCRVLDAEGQIIPGVYAAGELCGFAGGYISGSRAPEGIMIGGSLFSGRVAGAWAAHEAGGPVPSHLTADESVVAGR
jgi:predicted oxidoreductase